MSRTALVLGLGRFGGGREASAFLLRQGFTVRVADKATRASLAESVAALESHPRAEAVEWCLEREDPALLEGVDLLVCNPAIPDMHSILLAARARGIAVTQEIDLFLEHYPGKVLLVTGTNGKSTTTTLLARALLRSGLDVLAGGNLGKSLLAVEAEWRRDQIAVLEVSSFQLERLASTPRSVVGAVLVKITRDHLDRHGSLAKYWHAKAVAAAVAREFVVHGADDPVASGFATKAPRRVRFTRLGTAGADLAVESGWLVARLPEFTGVVAHKDALALLGDFHQENALAAFAAAVLCGADPHRAALAICTQEPLPYRLQLLLERAGRRIYDNAVSTEIESTESAVATLRSAGQHVHWIGGGKSKDGDYRRVADALVGKIASAHLFGAAAHPLAEAFAGRVPVVVHDRVPEALRDAWQSARPGESVLFSPAFASFDQYPNFRARAEEFRRAALELEDRSLAGGAGAT